MGDLALLAAAKYIYIVVDLLHLIDLVGFFIICNIVFRSDSSSILLFFSVRVLHIKYINYIPLVSVKKNILYLLAA